MKISNRLGSIPMSGIRKMFDLAGPNSINLGLGEPDLDPPKEAIEGMNAAASKGMNKYGPTGGIIELRKGVAEWFSQYGPLTANNVMITPSGSSALLEITQAFIDPGDEVLVPSPGFVIYSPHTVLAGGKPKEYKLTEGDFQPDIEDMKKLITKKTKMMVVNSPSNPTGGVLDKTTFKALLDLAEDHDVMILSDEVYDAYVYEGKHYSFIPHLDRAIVVNGFSKMMAVTGWRMGAIFSNENVMTDLVKMQYHVCASPNMPAQYGILNALPVMEGYLENARKIFKSRRDLISKRINNIDGMKIVPPKGSFYAFPSFDLKMSSEELGNALAKNGLICTPGSSFGKYGEGHVRFSYAANDKKINAGMDILEDVMGKLRSG
ncbi:MAG: pyridoxal phosphate-dependent aminotransferase [Methanomassiliicoccaceae archaeon]|nr:pyridoxal phosphate-dependent aminotransferase [Methanomassiliicoccaceae archaeon]MCL2318080.1 pyridoxal phosphate-dependent aminotransferase [Methanomassiliicoccaceae archaeon]